MAGAPSSNDPALQAAVLRGRQEGLATAALAASCVAWVNLLGAEKALLAMTLAGIALHGPAGAAARKRARIAIGLSAFYAVTWVAVLILYHKQLAHLLQALKNLG